MESQRYLKFNIVKLRAMKILHGHHFEFIIMILMVNELIQGSAKKTYVLNLNTVFLTSRLCSDTWVQKIYKTIQTPVSGDKLNTIY